MSTSSHAVFVSYASQDAVPARRICDALRSVGIDVWFDQSALRGGDAWDASIRRQIKECALFVPIISANTQVREEGYFRLEWKLAVDRSHLMADDRAFLLPVVIDATIDVNARVPEKFREVQWTHLRDGEAATDFAERVRRLFSGGESPARPAVPARATPSAAAAAAAIESPSIAVLPFVNMSRDEDNEYFADGLSEELLNVLAKIRGLRVASRTSAFSFKGKVVDIPAVAQKLNVATVLEGSVRKSGKRVRITVQLIQVASDSHLWSETYDRELDDIFAVQDDIAQSWSRSCEGHCWGNRRDLLQASPRRPMFAAPPPGAATIRKPFNSICRGNSSARGPRRRIATRRSTCFVAHWRSIRSSRSRGRGFRASTSCRRDSASRRSTRATRERARLPSRRCSWRPTWRKATSSSDSCSKCTTGTFMQPTQRSGVRWNSPPATRTRCAQRPASPACSARPAKRSR
jgi:TolB-like protein